jgi:[ribosomal protein S18]-alanine N-acetyltransferase
MMFHVRWCIRRDMPEVLAIEAVGSAYPWDEEEFLRCLRQRNCIGMVAEQNEKVFGFMIYELHKQKLHVLNLKVDKSLGSVAEEGSEGQLCFNALVDKLISKLSSHRRIGITWEVRESDLDVQIALKKKGFTAYSVNRESFSDSGEDGYAFKYVLPAESPVEVGGLEGD